ncbi:tumor necrosis factor receptor superfamily member 9-like [Rana temporaria]|uniref:tumor necrosis factor receptor superfamily member 9-like n=1 Tax=Rana temporaria TaxID=8407 RepID=UPI001AAD807A|nr:tumor necrosis factor receptor superfamily member 9-like [Rana temporaria]
MNRLWLPLVAFQSLVFAVTEGCRDNQYKSFAIGEDICCNYCGAGEEITKVCTRYNSTSTCSKCPKGQFNPANYRSKCMSCKICGTGSIEEKPCTKSSNAVCICPEGSSPNNVRNTACTCDRGKEIVNKKCQPCANGHFSSEENSKCRPWTNCSALGLTVLVPGSATNNVQCSKQKSTTVWVLPTSVTVIPPHTQRMPGDAETSTAESSITSTKHSTISNTMGALNWDTVTLILITVTLLMAMAGILLAVIIQTKKRKVNRGFIRSKKCKVPVQEESTDSESSLTKNNPV